jgi:hypothetical protein
MTKKIRACRVRRAIANEAIRMRLVSLAICLTRCNPHASLAQQHSIERNLDLLAMRRKIREVKTPVALPIESLFSISGCGSA